MYQLSYTNRFKKDLRLCQKRGLDINLITFLHERHE
jgi:mRNA-degrading endonuclease YafQ of YafQ-DinJ toxin-antitoxin module